MVTSLTVVLSLQDIEASQLLLFVQSFGIPIDSMNKLLTLLDQACATDSKGLEEVGPSPHTLRPLPAPSHCSTRRVPPAARGFRR